MSTNIIAKSRQASPPPMFLDTSEEQDLARMKKAVREISLQRVYMRNEMFREPLTGAEIRSCLAAQMR